MNTNTHTVIYNASGDTCECYTYTTRRGLIYYVCDGGSLVNMTYDTIEDGTDINEVSDVDCFTWNKPIESEQELMEAVEA